MFFGWKSRDVQEAVTPIPLEDIEKALSWYCTLPAVDSARPHGKVRFSDESIHHVAGLLEHLEWRHGRTGWKLRPRIYTVLRNIGRLDAMQAFVDRDLRDISLPYSDATLPDVLRERRSRVAFLHFQEHVLTDASKLEMGPEGGHVHFDKNGGNDHFHLMKHLGSGGSGYVSLIPTGAPSNAESHGEEGSTRRRSAWDDV